MVAGEDIVAGESVRKGVLYDDAIIQDVGDGKILGETFFAFSTNYEYQRQTFTLLSAFTNPIVEISLGKVGAPAGDVVV